LSNTAPEAIKLQYILIAVKIPSLREMKELPEDIQSVTARAQKMTSIKNIIPARFLTIAILSSLSILCVSNQIYSDSLKKITDTASINSLWRYFKNNAPVPSGTFHLQSAKSDTDSIITAIVFLHNGTEVGRECSGKADLEKLINPSISAPNLKKHRFFSGNIFESKFLTETFSGINSPAGLISFLNTHGQWNQGITLSYAWDQNGVMIGWYSKDNIRIEWMHKNRFLFYGGEIHITRHLGSLAYMLNEPTAQGANRQFNWQIKAGLPFLRIELCSRTSHIPEMMWIDEQMLNVMKKKDGTITNGHVGDSTATGDNARYLYTVIRSKLSVFRYSMLIDPQAFRHPIHTAGIHDIPLGFLRWRAEMTMTKGFTAPSMGISIDPFLIGLGKRKVVPVRISPIDIDAYYSNLKHWHFSLHSAVSIPDPLSGKGQKNGY
jgi:hypothetical protein